MSLSLRSKEIRRIKAAAERGGRRLFSVTGRGAMDLGHFGAAAMGAFARSGYLVVDVAADHRGTPSPLEPLEDLVRGLYSAADGLLTPVEKTRLFTPLYPLMGIDTHTALGRRTDAVQTIARSMTVISERHPLAVLIGFGHALDADTRAVFEELLTLVGGASRYPFIGNGEASGPVIVVTALQGEGPRIPEEGVTAITLEGLEATELGTLLKEPEILDAIQRRTDGVVDKIYELVHGLLSPPPAVLTPGERDALLADTLAALSSAGQPLTEDDLVAILGLTPPAVEEISRRGVERSVITRTGGLVELTDLAEPTRQLDVDASVLSHLERLLATEPGPRSSERYGIALDAMGHHHDAIPHLEEAADGYRAIHAMELAALLYERVLGLLDDTGAREAVVRKLVTCFRFSGRTDAIIDLIRSTSTRARDLTLELVTAFMAEGRFKEADDTIGALEGGHDIVPFVAETALSRDRFQEAFDTAVGGLAQAYRAGDDHGYLELCNIAGKAAYRLGRLTTAERLFGFVHRRTIELDRHHDAARALHNRAIIELRRGSYGEARALLDEALRESEDHGSLEGTALSLHNLGIVHEYRQEYHLAAEYLKRSIELFAGLQRRRNLAGALNSMADILVTTGEIHRAGELLKEAQALADHEGYELLVLLNRHLRGRILLAKGTHAEAIELLEEVFDELSTRGTYTEAHHVALTLGRALAETGNVRALDALLDTIDGIPTSPEPEIQGRGMLLVAWRAILEGDVTRCLDAAEAAYETLQPLEDRWGLLEASLLKGEALALAGEPETARRYARDAALVVADIDERLPRSSRPSFATSQLVTRLKTLEERITTMTLPPTTVTRPHREPSPASPRFPGIIGSSEAFSKVLTVARKVAKTKSSVLVLGESGTGKEVIAEAIHRQSDRRDNPFVRINSAALSESLLLSELFGHEKGAFTGAHARKIGKVEAAHRGTLFLDEIGDISPGAQAALLRFLETKEFERVGGVRTLKVDVRLISATNRDLAAMVEAGTFRLDLYHRIRQVTLELPAVRQRPGDIEELVDHFSGRIAHRNESAPLAFDEGAMELLLAHQWPGNVREIKNVLENLYLLHDGEVITRATLLGLDVFKDNVALDAGSSRGEVGPGFSLDRAKERLEIDYISQALEQTEGNITKAAKLLQMKRPRLSQKIKQYEIDVAQYRQRRRS